ncbi:MAG: hypothetical protein NDJ94_17960 [Vicinamibacteria bacterium]|nr:hypothetical protein [Vicinamibacteria bacterium]
MRRPRLAVAAVLVLLSGLALGGAARAADGGLLQGLPPLLVWAVVAAGAALLVVRCDDRGTCAALGGLWPVPVVILLAGAPWPGAGALTGRPLAALALAGVVLLWLSRRPRIPGWLFVPAVFAVQLASGAQSAVRVGPQGDEPHYLVVTESLLLDHDLRLERDFEQRRYLTFFDRPMEPHYRVRGREGAIYSLHAVGLSVLILPAYALAGYPGAVAFMALLTALLCNEVRLLLRRVLPEPTRADGLAVVFALSPPLLNFGGLVFTEVPAALAVAVVLRLGLEAQGGVGKGLAIGTLLGALPWLNARYSILSLLLALYVMAGRPGLRLWLPGGLVGALSAAGIASYHSILYGFFDPRRVYGRRPEFDPATLIEGGPGLLLDQEFGLLVYAPLFALAVPGLWSLRRSRPRLAAGAALTVAAMFLVAGTWHMWRGGFNPPARFLVPLWAPLVLGVGWALREAISARAALLIGWTLFVAASGVLRPELVHRDRDGTAPLWRVASGAEEWTRLLPAYVLAEPDRHRLAAIWGSLLLLAAVGRHRRATAGGLLAATAALAGAGLLAGQMTDAPPSVRDWTRLLGRPAVVFPTWSFEPRAEAGWLPLATDYAPHRFPGGLTLGERLELRAGSHELELRMQDRPPGSADPALLVVPERPGAWQTISAVDGRYRFRVDGQSAWRLALVGGGPGRIVGVQLRAGSTFSPSPGPKG